MWSSLGPFGSILGGVSRCRRTISPDCTLTRHHAIQNVRRMSFTSEIGEMLLSLRIRRSPTLGVRHRSSGQCAFASDALLIELCVGLR